MKQDAKDASEREELLQFLKSSVIQEVLLRMEKNLYAEFRAADTEQKRQDAWAKSAIMGQFLSELEGVKNRGVVAQANIERREAREAANARNPQRNTRK